MIRHLLEFWGWCYLLGFYFSMGWCFGIAEEEIQSGAVPPHVAVVGAVLVSAMWPVKLLWDTFRPARPPEDE